MATHAAVAASAPTCARRSRRSPSSPAASATRWCATWARSAARIANADPAACYPAGGARPRAPPSTPTGATIAADDFFTGLFETALQPGELITAVSFPIAAEGGLRRSSSSRPRASRWSACSWPRRRGGVRVAVTGAEARRVPRDRRSRTALAKSFTPEAAKAVKVPADGHQQRPARLGRVPRRDDQRDRRRGRWRRRWRAERRRRARRRPSRPASAV